MTHQHKCQSKGELSKKNANISNANGTSSLKYFLKTGSLNAPHTSNICISFTLVFTQLLPLFMASGEESCNELTGIKTDLFYKSCHMLLYSICITVSVYLNPIRSHKFGRAVLCGMKTCRNCCTTLSLSDCGSLRLAFRLTANLTFTTTEPFSLILQNYPHFHEVTCNIRTAKTPATLPIFFHSKTIWLSKFRAVSWIF